MIQTERPSDAPALNIEALWYNNKKSTIYCFGGARSFATPALNDLKSPPDSIWGFRLNGEGSGVWYQVLGPVSTPFPSDIRRVTGGTSASDGSSAYYIGGWNSYETSPDLQNFRSPIRGLLIFDFGTLTMTNSSDDSYLASQTFRPTIYGPAYTTGGSMINIPTYGDNGILLVLPDSGHNPNVGFNNITFYDKKTKKWYSQAASGDIPQIRSEFCAVGIEGDEKHYFEM